MRPLLFCAYVLLLVSSFFLPLLALPAKQAPAPARAGGGGADAVQALLAASS